MLIIRDTKACLPSSPRMVPFAFIEKKKNYVVRSTRKKNNAISWFLDERNEWRFVRIEKKITKNITSFEWKKHWKRLYSLVWWLLCSLVPWVRSTCPMPFASIVLKGRRRSLPRRLLGHHILGLHFQAMYRLLRHFHDKLDETLWLLMHLSDSFCEWVCCNNLWCCNCVDSRRFSSYKFRKSNRCLLTLVPCLTILTRVWTRPFLCFAREIGSCLL